MSVQSRFNGCHFSFSNESLRIILIICRYSIRDLNRWKACLLSRPRLPGDETIRAQLGGTLNATCAALGRFIQSISSRDSNETVQQLLTFCLDFEAGLIRRAFYDLFFFRHANFDATTNWCTLSFCKEQNLSNSMTMRKSPFF